MRRRVSPRRSSRTARFFLDRDPAHSYTVGMTKLEAILEQAGELTPLELEELFNQLAARRLALLAADDRSESAVWRRGRNRPEPRIGRPIILTGCTTAYGNVRESRRSLVG